MSGYFARVAAMALGGASMLRPALATRYGPSAFEGPVEPASETAPVVHGETARERDRERPRAHADEHARDTGVRSAARDDDGVRYDALHGVARDVRLGATARVHADGDREDARPERRRPHARIAGEPPTRDVEAEPAPRLHDPAERAGDAGATTAAARLLPLAAAPSFAAPPSLGSAHRRASTERDDAGGASDAADVYVHIGRIDVRAVSAPERRPAAPPRTELRKVSLEAHLRARDGGRA